MLCNHHAQNGLEQRRSAFHMFSNNLVWMIIVCPKGEVHGKLKKLKSELFTFDTKVSSL